MKNFKAIYSINFNKIPRSPKKIIYIIYHYTGMSSEKKAIERLTNKNSKVSCHYFIKRNGQIINMVPDKFIAWHAGVSNWKNHKNLNDKSIGIEIQVLSKILKNKYNIKAKNFLGHSDIAPGRKRDPGEKFPWKYFATHKIGIWNNLPEKHLKLRNINVSIKEKKSFYFYLKKIGYCIKKNSDYLKSVTKAFQRRYRPKLINGKIDEECLKLAKNLVKRGLN